MNPVILCYNLKNASAVKLTAMRFSIRIVTVQPEQYNQTLAALCGWESPADTAYDGAAFEDEMLVMAGFTNVLLNQFLQAFRRKKIPPVALKAILTETNSQWDSLQLHHELQGERETFEKNKKPLHQEPSAQEGEH